MKICFKNINKRVFLFLAILLVFYSAAGSVFPEKSSEISESVFSITIFGFSWFYALAIFALIVFCGWICVSKYGDIKLGGENTAPEMSMKNWIVVSLTSGMAYTILFYGVAEPMMHYLEPDEFTGLAGGSAEAAVGMFFSLGGASVCTLCGSRRMCRISLLERGKRFCVKVQAFILF